MLHRLSKAALLIALPILTVPAFGQAQSEPADAPTEKATKEEKVKEQKICKRLKTSMSSRRSTKVCKTREDWKAYDDENRGRPH